MPLTGKFYIIFFYVLVYFQLVSNLPILAQEQNSQSRNFPEPIFEHLTIADGLPENTVWCILQDHFGYMWFGTQNGLVNYNGYEMIVYQPETDDSLSISDRQVIKIYEDKSGTLWIGTRNGGLNRFGRAKETFTRYMHNPDDSSSISNNFITCINEDENGNIWVGTNNGLNLFNKSNDSFKHIGEILDDKKTTILNYRVGAIIEDRQTGILYVASDDKILIYDTEKECLTPNDGYVGIDNELGIIYSFYQATDGTIWIGHSMGLSKLNPLHNSIKLYQPISSDIYTPENHITDLTEGENGIIWGSTAFSGTGLISFDPKNEQFNKFKYDPDKKGSLSNNLVLSVYKDWSGIIWAGTNWAGLNKWDRKKYKFKRFSFDPNNPGGERFNKVRAITEDSEGIIWFGTDNGLNSFNRFSNEFRNYKFNTKHKSNHVIHIYTDESGIVWLGTGTSGLVKFDVGSRTFHFYSNDPSDSTTISRDDVKYILPGVNDVLWIGTWGGGLNRFDKKTGGFKRFTNDPKNPRTLSQDQIVNIYQDRKGKLWIGTNSGGLNYFNKNDKSFKYFNIEGGTAVTTIASIYEDSKGNFWIGTYHTGLYLFNRDKGISFGNITEKNGLAHNQTKAIVEDNSGNLWISTLNGLSRLDIQTYSIKNYFTSDVFNGNRYWSNSGCRTSTGEMLFGTADGFIMFHPDSIKDDPVPPQVVISNVSLFNRPGDKLTINGFISELNELELSYNENDLRFDYVGLHFGEPEKNQYKYMLENFDDDWVDAGTQRNATYTNLDAGEYVFRVTACNRDGVWNQQAASLEIIIPPPFWATWWAYILYGLISISVLYFIRRYELNRTNLKNQHKLDEVKLKERIETDKMKSRFFANISHEFRTPLTLILGPAENINRNSSGEEIEKQTNVIKRNAKRLLGLINQLLDLSKLEAGKLELKASKSNIFPFIKGITMSFESIAERKDITLKVKSANDEIEMYFDNEKMTKIMTNLLSNAFKFTPEGGEIIVSVTSSHAEFISASSSSGEIPKQALLPDRQVPNDTFRQKPKRVIELKVRDTGVGISEEELPKLFDIFYQVDSSQTREHEGTGIGLALTKELVELHHGTISVNSNKGDPDLVGTGWTEFTIELPLGRKHLKDEEIVDYLETEETKDVILIPHEREKNLVIESEQSIEVETVDKTIILIVEDNADVREFIKDSLGDDFQIEEASNGEQGVRKAEKIIPDLIISDIMMPKMDGNELTRMLKNDEKTSHIPIILLTAKSEQESRLEGLETGADDYLTKPFDTKELQIRIKNLISIRRKLQKKFSAGDYLPVKQGDEKKLSNLEEQFMCKVIEVIENHLSEEEFSIEQFGKEVGMDRVQLHRKLKALSGKSPSTYLRSVRLVRAKKMIMERKGNVSEIAYSVGFSSPQYFTRCFKEEFGHPPSDLAV